MHAHAGNEEALSVAEGIAEWTRRFFSSIGDDQRQRMLRTEYGGMNESLVNLAQITGKDRYLSAAKLFEQPTILDPLAQRKDELQGLHANTTIAKIVGAARTYEVTGDRRYREIAEYFLDEVLRMRSYAIGNTSDDEHWRTPAGDLKGTLSLKNAECCVAYNLMKLDRLAFGWTADAHWMDEIRTHIVQRTAGHAECARPQAVLLSFGGRILARLQLGGRIVLVLHRHRSRGLCKVQRFHLLLFRRRPLCEPVHRFRA